MPARSLHGIHCESQGSTPRLPRHYSLDSHPSDCEYLNPPNAVDSFWGGNTEHGSHLGQYYRTTKFITPGGSAHPILAPRPISPDNGPPDHDPANADLN
jgi:hypothetical protein